MAKKRKLRSSDPSPAKPAEPQDQQEPSQASQPEPVPEEVAQQEPQSMAVDDSAQENPASEVEPQIGEPKADKEQEQEERADLNAPSEGGVASEPAASQVNGAADENNEEEEDGDDVDEEPVEKLLEPFTKEQLTMVLKQAVAKYPDLIESVRGVADADPAHRKIFVHGLGWDATAEALISVFGKYGEIEDCKAVTDRVSGKSKGYAFILFKHRSGARKALKQPQKKIGNRITSCQLASTGPVPAPPPSAPPVSEYTQRKIFVSNVSAEVNPDKLSEFFKQFGEVEEGPLGLDKQTGKPKGFALFVYKSVESAKRALEEPCKNFEGITLHCQKAIDGPKPGKNFGGHQQHHQYHQPQYSHHRKDKNKYAASGGSTPGHLMAPSGPAVGFNAGPTQAFNPALGQALTAILATQGAGLGIESTDGPGDFWSASAGWWTPIHGTLDSFIDASVI
ncbi:hypothetical protein BT93_J0417 [Corymbia citriodora subsp. variegata]|nr:hypothetical protein BT93_J0417 [Corymbia citriodora subsp. variegata]